MELVLRELSNPGILYFRVLDIDDLICYGLNIVVSIIQFHNFVETYLHHRPYRVRVIQRG